MGGREHSSDNYWIVEGFILPKGEKPGPEHAVGY